MTATFDVAVYLIACARDCLDEPPLFGPRRMVEAAARLAAAEPRDPTLRDLDRQISEQLDSLLEIDREQFASWLDQVLAELASEATQRKLHRDGEPRMLPPLISSFYEAYNAHDVDAVAGLYEPTASHYEVAQQRRAEGIDAISHGLRRFLDSFPDARWLPQASAVSDGNAAVAYRLTGTLAVPMGPFRTAGRHLDLEGVHWFKFASGRIVATADYWDASTFARQMQRDG